MSALDVAVSVALSQLQLISDMFVFVSRSVLFPLSTSLSFDSAASHSRSSSPILQLAVRVRSQHRAVSAMSFIAEFEIKQAKERHAGNKKHCESTRKRENCAAAPATSLYELFAPEVALVDPEACCECCCFFSDVLLSCVAASCLDGSCGAGIESNPSMKGRSTLGISTCDHT